MIVYLITFSNGKSYVGVTSDLRRRLREHRTGNFAVGAAMRKHSWTAQELFCGTAEQCFAKEVQFIADLKTLSPGGYNLTTGGEGGFDMPLEAVQRRGASISKAFTLEKRLEHSRKLSASHRAPGMQEAQSERARRSWADPKFRDAVSSSAREQSKARWTDPAFRARHKLSMERYRQSLKQGDVT